MTQLTYRPRTATTDIIIHDSHTKPSVATVTDYLRAYGRTLGLLDIGYHWVIERSGVLVACRGANLIGSHTPGHNLRSIGICLAGGQDGQGEMADNFTVPQMLALEHLVETLLVAHGRLKVWGHTELQRYRNRALQCPAFDMRAWREQALIPHPR